MTDKCNMACKYCYAGSAWEDFLDIKKHNESFNSKIPLLFEFIDQVMSYNKFNRTVFSFHGGEPLLISLENWDSILNYFREKKYHVEIHTQTNGTVINDDFINLFKKFNVRVGVSLDSPASMNDKNRVFKNGRGSFSTIFRNLQKFKNTDLNFGCLVTINATNIRNIEKIYTFFKKYNISFGIRPIFETRYSVSKEFMITPQEYAVAFCKLFDLWFDDTETKNSLITDFVNMIARFINPIEGLATCIFIKSCSKHFVCFDLEGNLYPCDRLRGEADFLYGNIQKDDLVNLLDSPITKQLSFRWEKLSKTSCKDCYVSHYCNGGCPANGYYYYGGYFKKDYFCGAFKIILNHVYERIKSSLGDKVD